MWPDRVSNPGPLFYEFYESGALPTALRGPAESFSACGNNTLAVCLSGNTGSCDLEQEVSLKKDNCRRLQSCEFFK